ncbi:MAG: hypothetical protein QOE19_1825 [Actinomycetota bacterium]|nr:hypothetical protein [Actinomycetota bacterium]
MSGTAIRGNADDAGDAPMRLFHLSATSLGGQSGTTTGQTANMRRVEAISGRTVGSRQLWMGQTHVAPGTSSGDHHHGASETGIYVLSGNPVFVFLQDGEQVRLHTSPGDYVYVPPWVPHREENPDPDTEAVVVISRTTQEAIVVNLPDLHPPDPHGTVDPTD